MPVKTLQKIRDQAILLGPRPPQTGDRHVLVVGHDDPMIVRLHFTPFSSFRRNQRYYPFTRSKNPVYVTFNNQSSKNRRRYSFYCELSCMAIFFGGRKVSRRSYVYLPWSLASVNKKWDDVRDDSRPDADWISNLWTVEDVEEGNHRK